MVYVPNSHTSSSAHKLAGNQRLRCYHPAHMKRGHEFYSKLRENPMLLLTGTSSVKTEQRSISSLTKLSSCSSIALTQLASKYCNIHFALDHMEKAIKKMLLTVKMPDFGTGKQYTCHSIHNIYLVNC